MPILQSSAEIAAAKRADELRKRTQRRQQDFVDTLENVDLDMSSLQPDVHGFRDQEEANREFMTHAESGLQAEIAAAAAAQAKAQAKQRRRR